MNEALKTYDSNLGTVSDICHEWLSYIISEDERLIREADREIKSMIKELNESDGICFSNMYMVLRSNIEDAIKLFKNKDYLQCVVELNAYSKYFEMLKEAISKAPKKIN